MLKIGVVGIPGAWSSEQLANAVEKRTGYRLIINLDQVVLDLDSETVWYLKTDLLTLDALIIKKAGTHYQPAMMDRLEICRFLAEKGLPVFSDPRRIMGVLDRLTCTIALKNGQIPMPPTVVTESVTAAEAALDGYGEAVFKPLFSTKARGMEVITRGAGSRRRIEAYARKNGIMYIQKRLDLGGKDLGVVFLGGKYLTTYARCAVGTSWNTTTRSGGHYRACDPSGEIIALAHRPPSLFKLDFTCVDVAETDQGPVVFEVSAFGGFKGIQVARGIDAADRYAAHVIETLRKK